ncbi:MAG: hypothetical protein QXV28_08900 [Ignisphaera sp.]
MEILLILIRLLILYPTLLPLIFYLSILTWYDLKYREISDALILAGVPGIATGLVVYILINRINSLFTFNILSSVIIGGVLIATTYLLVMKGQMGSGDIPILLLTTMALLPYTVEFYGIAVPLVLVVMVLGIIYVFAEMIINVIHNAKRMSYFSKATSDCRTLEKVYYFLTTKVFRSDEFKNLRFYFPVKHGGIKRFTAKVGIEPLSGSEHEILGDVVLAVKGIPFIAILLTGTVLATLWIILSPVC